MREPSIVNLVVQEFLNMHRAKSNEHFVNRFCIMD